MAGTVLHNMSLPSGNQAAASQVARLGYGGRLTQSHA